MTKRSGHGDKFKTRLAENTLAAGLPDTPANRKRIEDATWIDLAMDNTRAAILRGESVEVSALERLAAARNSLLPETESTLRIVWNEQCQYCPQCGWKSEPTEIPCDERAHAIKQPSGPVDPASPADASATALVPAPAPSNVMPLRSVHDHVFAPLAREEPWRAPIASEFRRFDIPENF